jgi:hypothetical protein
MTDDTTRRLAPRILAASTRLLMAQRELSAAMADLALGGRDTTMISERLRLAFDEVTAAKVALAELVEATD